MEYNRSRMIQNIYSIAKTKGKKIGDIETAAGVSAGYISRLAKDDSKGAFTVDFLASIAEQLGVTLDVLAFTDDGQLTENEAGMLTFLDRLTVDTEKYELEWNLLDPRTQDDSFLFEHPLFRVRDDGCSEDPDGNYHYYSYTQYDSRFFPPKEAKINGNCYTAKIDDYSNTKIYLMNVRLYGNVFDTQKKGFEIYFIAREETVTPIMCSLMTCDQLTDAIARLYNAVESARSHLTVSDNVRNIMNRYLKTGEK